jgi:hypothetical protein
VEFNGMKVIGTVVVAVGLLGGAFLAGGLTSGDSGGAPSSTRTPVATPQSGREDKDDDKDVVLVTDDDADEDTQDAGNGGTAVEEEDEQPAPAPQQPEPTAPAPVEPTPAPVEPTPTATPAPVNATPFVVSISPADGVNGVARNADIVVTFSEPMDRASAQAALNPSTGNCGAFSWNGDDTQMTFDPCADFAYGTEVSVVVYDSAADTLGLGMMDDFESAFLVLRQSTIKLWSQDAYDGYVYGPGVFVFGDKAVADGQYFSVSTWTRGFLSFDLDDLPEDLVEIQSAMVAVKQTSHDAGAYGNATGKLLVEGVSYGTLTTGDWNLPGTITCGFCLIPVLGTDAADGWKTTEVAGYVRSDWENRMALDYNSQFRLRFAKDCGDGSCSNVGASFVAGMGNGVVRPYLSITYTHP